MTSLTELNRRQDEIQRTLVKAEGESARLCRQIASHLRELASMRGRLVTLTGDETSASATLAAHLSPPPPAEG
jgi:hypothetical protein